MSCSRYANCVHNMMNDLEFPIDVHSLYQTRDYDDQTSRHRCYSKFPINIIEGFGSPLCYSHWFIIILIVALVALIAFELFGKN